MLHIHRSGVRLDQCSCVGTFVIDLFIIGSSLYGSTTFRMSTRRLPVLLFVSRSSAHYILLFVARCAYGGRGGTIFYLHPMAGQYFNSLIVFCLSSSSRRLRRLSANLAARASVKGYSVNCFCSDISYFYYMSVSCPSGLCFSASLPLVTSQTRLESDVLEPQPGVTAGFAICSRLWEFRTGIQRSLLSPPPPDPDTLTWLGGLWLAAVSC